MLSNVLGLLSFATFLLVLAAGVAVIRKEGARNPITYAYLLLLEFPLVAALGYTFMHLTHDKAEALFFYKLGALGWCPGPSSTIYFMYRSLLYSRNERVNPYVAALIFLPAPIFYYGVLTGRMIAYDFTRTAAGWIESIDPASPWVISYIISMAVMFVCATIAIIFLKRSPLNRHRTLAKMIILPAAGLSAVALCVNVLLPMLGALRLPPLGHIFVGTFLAAFGFVILRYPMFSINPRFVMDTIILKMHDVMLLTDLAGVILEANPALQYILEYDHLALRGKHIRLLFPDAVVHAMGPQHPQVQEFRDVQVTAAGGYAVPCSGSIHLVQDTFQDPIGHLIMLHDIREIKRLEERSVTDPLTGAYNRLKVNAEIKAALGRQDRHQIGFSVILFDIDRFKDINDSYGHDAGDQILIDITQIVWSSVRSTDVLARWGGEEFLVICSGANLENAVELAERIRKKVEGFTFKIPRRVTVSFGVTEASANDTPELIVKRADEAMYEAKRTGRNKTCTR